MTLTTEYQLLSESIGGVIAGESSTKYAYLRIYAKYNEQSIENNTSIVAYRIILYVTGGGTYFYTSNTTKMINATGIIEETADASGTYYLGETLLFEKNATINHDTNGDASINVSGAWNSNPWEVNLSTIATAKLPSIPRASKISGVTQVVSSIPNSNNRVYVSYNKYSPNFTDNIAITYSGNTITRENIQPNTYIEFTTQEIQSMLSYVKSNSTSISGTVTLTTYKFDNQGNQVLLGSDNVSIWWTMGQTSETIPSISGYITVTETSSAVLSLTNGNKFIKDYSNVLVRFIGSSNAKYSASINRYTLNDTFNMLNNSTGALYQLRNLNTNSFDVKAIDTRNFKSSSVTKTIDLINDYNVPVISNFVANREGGVSEEVLISFNAKLWKGNFGNGNNTITLFKYRVKRENGNWGNWFDITSRIQTEIQGQDVGNLRVSNVRIYSDGNSEDFELGISFDVEVYLSDGITTQTFNNSESEISTIDDGLILDCYNKTSTGYQYAINGIVDTTLGDGLQVNGNLYLNGSPITSQVLGFGHVRYGRTIGAYIPAETTSRYSLNRLIGVDTAGKTSLNDGQVTIDASVKFVIVTIAIQSSGANSWLNIYPHLWNVSTQSHNDFEGVVTIAYANTGNTQGTFGFEVYMANAETLPYDDYWNYVDITYIYEI
ncbi:MAG: hypothetical protein IJ690_02065 [Clostridia bacterium]|nr:hypothetical protein [Clostridia bacterium]MBR1653727.1 hypothetical protein [Clostridia bacterium]